MVLKTKNIIFSLFLTFILFSMPVLGEQPRDYTLEGLELSENKDTLLRYNGNCQILDLGKYDELSNTRVVGREAFANNVMLTEIVLPRSIRVIGNGAFVGCKRLTKVSMPDSVEHIRASAFWECNALRLSELPSNLKTIDENAFVGCSNITITEIPKRVTSVGIRAFAYCSKITSMKLSPLMDSIPMNMFFKCTNLKTIEIPENVKHIGRNAFYGCENLVRNQPQNTGSQYECIYKYTVSGKDKNGTSFNDDSYCMLQMGTGIGKFYDYSSYQTDSVKQANSTDQIVNSYKLREQRNVFFFDQTVYQNSPKGKMTVQSVITPNYYYYEENRNPIKWIMKEGVDSICGYLCQIAQGQYGGRTWTVRYAPEIPTQNGPWKLTGLPGLILDAIDSEGEHHFNAITFRKSPVKITPLNNSGSIATSREKFIQAKNRFEENPIGNIPPESIGEMEVRKHSDNPPESTILINGIQLRMRLHPYIPLEIE